MRELRSGVRTTTVLLRLMLILLALGLVAAVGLLNIVSLDLAHTYPSHADMRLPLFLAAAVTAIPALVAVHALWAFLALADRGEALSPQTVCLFRRVKFWFAGAAVYLLVAFVAVEQALLPDRSPSVFLGWCAAEVVAVFVVAFAAVFERLFATATAFRVDSELTV